MQVTLTELKTDTEKYIDLAGKKNIFVMKDGLAVAKITGTGTDTAAPFDKVAAVKSLFGIIPGDLDFDALKTERIMS
ncbi:MAG: hypothetical protein LBM98_00150 [Oscillospiraceae bacterium]|jgi:hypothetical protein|nr:hypothetical protein [Oscillospiraceae bacterium]